MGWGSLEAFGFNSRGTDGLVQGKASIRVGISKDYFVGKTIIITGAASGIGRATALTFAREGANVVCVDIHAEGLEEVVEAVKRHGAGAIAAETDVSDRAAVSQMVKAAVKRFGLIDFQFNAAGAAGRWTDFLGVDDDLWERTMAVNANGVFYCMQEILPHMLDNGGGVIVNAASMAHRRGGPGALVHYAAAKGAVVSMTMGVAREFADRGVRAISIAPGPIETPFQDAAGATPEFMERSLADIPMGRLGRPEEIGELVLFLCSGACGFLTADTIYVNGGGGWR